MLAVVASRISIPGFLVAGASLLFVPHFSNLAFGADTSQRSSLQAPAEKPVSDHQPAPRFILYFGTEQKPIPDSGLNDYDLAGSALSTLTNTSEEFQRIFGVVPKSKVVLRFLNPSEFRRLTKAPDWTSAMFYRGEISIPINEKRGVNPVELHRALRHEYVHAVIAEITNYRSPAWIDEGIAQLLEGQINPLLGPALRTWIRTNSAMPLSSLENGFTTLPGDIVPAAYAQSLFATRTLVQQYGFSSAVKFLSLLGEGKSEAAAFLLAFNETEEAFEARLTAQIKRWADSEQINP